MEKRFNGISTHPANKPQEREQDSLVLWSQTLSLSASAGFAMDFWALGLAESQLR